jgi:hypothetical protein
MSNAEFLVAFRSANVDSGCGSFGVTKEQIELPRLSWIYSCTLERNARYNGFDIPAYKAATELACFSL